MFSSTGRFGWLLLRTNGKLTPFNSTFDTCSYGGIPITFWALFLAPARVSFVSNFKKLPFSSYMFVKESVFVLFKFPFENCTSNSIGVFNDNVEGLPSSNAKFIQSTARTCNICSVISYFGSVLQLLLNVCEK